MERICVGVDAGGTHVAAARSRDGRFERELTGPGANVAVLGAQAAAASIAATVRTLLAGDVAANIVVGAAGVGRGDGRAALARALETAFTGAHVVVFDDAEIALQTVAPDGPGVVALAGTGSIALAVNGGTQTRVGGLGYLVGDEGSAFAIGMAATKLLGRVYDGRAPRDETTDLVARDLGASDRASYLDAVYGPSFAPARIAALAPAVIAFAGKGNRVAAKIVQAASAEFGELVKAAAKLAGLLDASPTVVLGGGLFRENSMYTFLVETRVVGDIAGAAIVRMTEDASRGALRLAEAHPVSA
jgi:N-acetylglucosamine kinase-like BadF-type ATPase